MAMAITDAALRSVCRLASFAIVIGLVCFASSPSHADLPRSLVQGIQKVGGGQEIERFVLLQTVHIAHPNMRRADAMEYWMLPSVFVPVSEDSEGVYYQATSGFRIYRGTMGQRVVPGGLYVSKTRSDRILPYVGNAKELRESLRVDTFQLLLDARQKLKVARAERER
jgi:hypothetical protein